jgi:hypothetical protein
VQLAASGRGANEEGLAMIVTGVRGQKQAVLAAIACTSLIALAACGGSDNPAPAPAPTQTQTAAATAAPTAVPTAGQAGAGLDAKIETATLQGAIVVVTFSLTDGEGVPLTPVLTSGQTEQQARTRFTVAHLENYSGGGDLANTFYRYVNDVNPTTPAMDSKGKLSTLDAATGLYQFTFSTALPNTYVNTETLSVGMQVNRTYQGTAYRFNQV